MTREVVTIDDGVPLVVEPQPRPLAIEKNAVFQAIQAHQRAILQVQVPQGVKFATKGSRP
jgi:hypothetical protein